MKQFGLFEEMVTFAIVVEEQSFTEAAKRLGRSKAYVSHQLSRLEEALGVVLLYRTTRKLELTEAGRACLEGCRAVQAAGKSVWQAAAAVQGEMVGSLRITVPVSFGEAFGRDIVFDFIQQYPEIKIALELENSQRDLIEGGYDLAIRASAELQDELVALRVGDLVYKLCGEPGYLENHPAILVPSDLLKHRCIVNDHQIKNTVWAFEQDGQVENVTINSVVAVNHYPLIKQAVLAGQGIARLPEYLVRKEIAQSKLVALLENYSFERTPVYVVYPYTGPLPKRTRVMIDFVVSWLRDKM